jgi:hypothetical protein
MNKSHATQSQPGRPGMTNSSTGGLCTPYDALIKSVDSFPELLGAGIMLVKADGTQVTVRGGPRRRWVWITPKGFGPVTVSPGLDDEEKTNEPTKRPMKNETPGFWDRWGDSVLNCGSAAATGVVIYLSGGTASFWVGAFAVNSAMLCGTSIGKGIYYDEWQEFKSSGGEVYTSWMTVETFMNLADLANGVSGTMKLLRAWEKGPKLAKLSAAVKGKNVTRANLLKLIQEIDPSFRPNLSATGAKYISKGKLLTIGGKTIRADRFVSLMNHQSRVIFDGISNALTLLGTPSTGKNVSETWDLWVVDYKQ